MVIVVGLYLLMITNRQINHDEWIKISLRGVWLTENRSLMPLICPSLSILISSLYYFSCVFHNPFPRCFIHFLQPIIKIIHIDYRENWNIVGWKGKHFTTMPRMNLISKHLGLHYLVYVHSKPNMSLKNSWWSISFQLSVNLNFDLVVYCEDVLDDGVSETSSRDIYPFFGGGGCFFPTVVRKRDVSNQSDSKLPSKNVKQNVHGLQKRSFDLYLTRRKRNLWFRHFSY